MASFRKRSNRWQARVHPKGMPVAVKTFDTRADAEKWARAMERDNDLGIYTDRAKLEAITTAQLIERYRQEVVPQLRGAHTETIRLNTLCRFFGNYPLAALSPHSVAAYRDLRLKSVSASTVMRELQSLSALLNHARREWSLPVKNSVADIRKPPPNRARARRLDSAEEARLLNALVCGGRKESGQWGKGTRNPWIAPLVRLALATAMRRGELLTLRWENIDLQRRTAFLPQTKNGDPRTVPLSTEAVTVLQALPRSMTGYVFPISAEALKHAWVRACASAGVIDLHFHDLRHEAISRMADKLPNLIELASVTGHRDLKMLARYYHPRTEELARKLG